jgi:hypothetical protein
VFLAPEWLVRATPAIALLAMLISLTSFALALKTYRRAGARVGVEYEVGTVTITDNRRKGDTKEEEVPAIVIHLTNSGMTSISINDFLLRPPTIIGYFRIGPYLAFDEDYDVERLSGKKLPVKLRPNTAMDWAYRIKSAGLAEGWHQGSDQSP